MRRGLVRRSVAAALCAAPLVIALAGPMAAHAAIPTGNLLANRGAEDGPGAADANATFPPPGWTQVNGAGAVQYNDANGFPTLAESARIRGGSNFFAGGLNNNSYVYQSNDVTGAAAEIDAGQAQVTLSGWLGGYLDTPDRASLRLFPYDSSGNFLGPGPTTVGPVGPAERGNKTGFAFRSTTSNVPPGTRRLYVDIFFERFSGAYNDGYADNIGLCLSAAGAAPDPVCQPPATATGGGGGGGNGALPPPKNGGQTIIGGTGNTRLTGTPGDDVIVCGDGNDTVIAGAGDDFIDCKGGNDLIDAGAGDDRVRGGAGRDRIRGGSGEDRVRGGSGRDRVRGGSGSDRVTGGSGNDRIAGGSGSDRLFGNSGRDRLFGNSGRDRLRGGSGRDRLFGGSGRDRLAGGSGLDLLFGGPGRDVVRQ